MLGLEDKKLKTFWPPPFGIGESYYHDLESYGYYIILKYQLYWNFIAARRYSGESDKLLSCTGVSAWQYTAVPVFASLGV